MVSKEEETRKAVVFVKHIEDHLQKIFPPKRRERGTEYRIYPPKVVCKICNKTIDEIFEEEA